jgi:hypothetical protein
VQGQSQFAVRRIIKEISVRAQYEIFAAFMFCSLVCFGVCTSGFAETNKVDGIVPPTERVKLQVGPSLLNKYPGEKWYAGAGSMRLDPGTVAIDVSYKQLGARIDNASVLLYHATPPSGNPDDEAPMSKWVAVASVPLAQVYGGDEYFLHAGPESAAATVSTIQALLPPYGSGTLASVVSAAFSAAGTAIQATRLWRYKELYKVESDPSGNIIISEEGAQFEPVRVEAGTPGEIRSLADKVMKAQETWNKRHLPKGP